VRLEGLDPLKNPMTSSEIEPADISSELGIYTLTEKIQITETNWTHHVEGMEANRLLKYILH
jgi:hypothetical protein